MKKIISISICVALLLSIGVVAYAATSGFTMTYLPGTNDTVTNLPANDNGTGGQAYTVSNTVPKREGYEFLGWTLDYDVAEAAKATYTVRYLDFMTEEAMEEEKVVSVDKAGNPILDGATVTECAVEIPGYTPVETEITQEIHDGDAIIFWYYEISQPN